jgi:CheY-like chemotaxis protein
MKIVVVDDNQDLGVILGIRLRRLGHVALLAIRADDALYMLTPDVDALITDIDMPLMNGVELAREARARMPALPIVFCTGSDPRSQLARAAAELGPVLPKAIRPEQARTVVSALIGEPAALRSAPRIAAYLAASYRRGERSIRCFTENLSRGGLFLRDAVGLASGEHLELSIELPTGPPCVVEAEVRYVLSRGEAVECGRQPGAGLRVCDTADTRPIVAYLERLKRRRYHVIMTNDTCCASLFSDAGYGVREAPPPDELARHLAEPRRDRVCAVFVSPSELDEYARAATAAGRPRLVRPSAPPIVLNEAMAELDLEL